MSREPEPGATLVELKVYADYYQFYLKDPASPCDTGTIWDDPVTTDRQLAVGDGLVAVGTKRYGTVPVHIEILRSEPPLDRRGLDRINECGITTTTTICVGNPISLDPLTELASVGAGTYGVRVLYLFQNEVTDDITGDDHYVIQIWPTLDVLPTRYLKP